MTSLQNYIGQELQWSKPRLTQRFYELRAPGDQVLATLSRSGVFKERTVAEAEGQKWTFKRQGGFKPRIYIYPGEEPGGEPLAIFNRRWSGKGELVFSDGHTFQWNRTGFWNPTLLWMTPEGITLLSIKRRKRVEIAPEAYNLSDLSLLATLGRYLILLAEEEAAAASAAATASSF